MPIRASFGPLSHSLSAALPHALALVLGLSLVGCGAKSALYEPPPVPDAGPIDAYVPPPLEVDCGRPYRRVAVARPFLVRASVEAGSPVTFEQWTVTSEPPGSAVGALPPGRELEMTVNEVGVYDLTFEAHDEAGNVGICSVQLEATDEAVAICPPEAEYRARVDEPVRLQGDASSPSGRVEARWEQTEGPAPARIVVVAGDGAVVDVIAPAQGLYTFVLTAETASGTDSCVVRIRINGPPVVTCGPPITAPTRQPVTIHATAVDEDLASVGWEMVTRPDTSSATNAPLDQTMTTFTPDRVGRYVLRFTAIDSFGERASCEQQVDATPTPPDAICPPVIETRPLNTVTVEGRGVDDGTIVAQGWSIEREPPGSDAAEPSPPNAARAEFTPQLAGEYTLRFFVRDDDGNEATCTTLVRAVAVEGLRVEMFWDTGSTDMDTHLLRPGATRWYTDDDCYYSNCQDGRWGGDGLEWPPRGPDGNPSLDIDDTDGYGPENINIELPTDGTYRVGVHAWRGMGRVTVRIYCGGSTTEPRQVFGPVRINSDTDDLWRVADVTIAGSSCRIEDLSSGGRPSVGPCVRGDGCPR